MSDDRMMATARTLPFPPEAVYRAFETPELLAAWWGPDGFTNAFKVFEFKVGGRWIFDMRAPNGQTFANNNVFVDLQPAKAVVIRHDGLPYFTLTVRLDPVAGEGAATVATRLTWEQLLDDSATAQAVRHIVLPANEQNLDRLTRVLQAAAAPDAT